MTSSINHIPTGSIQGSNNTNPVSETNSDPQPTQKALRLPDTPELLTHLKLIDAIICLRSAIDIQGEEYGIEPGKAWENFCRAASVKFLRWSQDVDVSEITIPIPPLDILMIWHSYMLNTKDYVQFQDTTRRGELAGKGFDWEDLDRELDIDYDGMPDILGSWDPSNQTHGAGIEVLAAADFDMVAAVQRQLRFAEKVYCARWRNPDTIDGFLDTAIGSYRKFFSLIAENPGVGLAPTLAIDLVWHTHQLSPKRYRAYCRHMTNGRFVHHDDNIDETSLEEAGRNAEELYLAKYGVPYRSPEGAMCFGKPEADRAMCFGKPEVSRAMCFAKPEMEDGRSASRPENPSCSTACRSNCSTACRSGCANYCRGGLCRDQCRAACGYVCGACETKELAATYQ